jgi:hypothetical protein
VAATGFARIAPALAWCVCACVSHPLVPHRRYAIVDSPMGEDTPKFDSRELGTPMMGCV